MHARGLRRALAEQLEHRHPGRWSSEAHVCPDCLNEARIVLLLAELERERGEFSAVEAEVARKAAGHLAIAEQIDEEFQRNITPGQRLADRVARVGGSWPFVVGFCAVLAAWVGINAWFLRERAFDPYPFILLNLVLSCIAALQAPVIMMSQNRMAARDRVQADQDFRVNLKAEIEIASLHDKVDHVLHAQWQHMVELQQLQIDLLNEILEERGEGEPA
ncbi:MAG: DUF1003 domain-containing protein [Planctomycetes bacterium]|nr:DUF1003 domain-containing protein [Planctomycetota bacterium]